MALVGTCDFKVQYCPLLTCLSVFVSVGLAWAITTIFVMALGAAWLFSSLPLCLRCSSVWTYKYFAPLFSLIIPPCPLLAVFVGVQSVCFTVWFGMYLLRTCCWLLFRFGLISPGSNSWAHFGKSIGPMRHTGMELPVAWMHHLTRPCKNTNWSLTLFSGIQNRLYVFTGCNSVMKIKMRFAPGCMNVLHLCGWHVFYDSFQIREVIVFFA